MWDARLIVDIAATALDVFGLAPDADAPGRSLHSLAASPDNPDRTVFAEYHDGGSSTGAFMVRWRNWKYIHYSGLPPQLFDLDADPDELVDLGADDRSAPLKHGRMALGGLPPSVTPTPSMPAVSPIRRGGSRLLAVIDACRNAYLFNHTPTPDEQGAMERLDG